MPATSTAFGQYLVCFCGGKHLLMQKQNSGVNLKRFGFASCDSGDPKCGGVDLKRGSGFFKMYLKVSYVSLG